MIVVDASVVVEAVAGLSIRNLEALLRIAQDASLAPRVLDLEVLSALRGSICYKERWVRYDPLVTSSTDWSLPVSLSPVVSGSVACLSRFGPCVLAVLFSSSPASSVGGYGDVTAVWQKAPVQWAVDNGIIDIAGSCFTPNAGVTRGEAAVYFWRMEGRPSAPDHRFTDITDRGQDSAISWMSSRDITTGTSPTHVRS